MSWGDWTGRVPLQNPDLAWRVVDDECIVVDPQSSQATVLNPVGTRLWELVDGKRSVSQILDCLLEEYEVERERLESDAREFLDDLEKKRLVRYQDS